MSERAEACRLKAVECQRAALATADPKMRQMYLSLATQWKELAEYTLVIEQYRRRGLLPMPREDK